MQHSSVANMLAKFEQLGRTTTLDPGDRCLVHDHPSQKAVELNRVGIAISRREIYPPSRRKPFVRNSFRQMKIGFLNALICVSVLYRARRKAAPQRAAVDSRDRAAQLVLRCSITQV